MLNGTPYGEMMRVFHNKSPSDHLSRLVRLAECVGITSELFEVQNSAVFVSALEQSMLLQTELAVFDVESLKAVCSRKDLDAIATLVSNHKVSVLLLITTVEEDTNCFMRVLTKEGALRTRLVDKATRINFSSGAEGLAGELANQSYPRKPIQAVGLTLGSGPEVDCIMRLNDSPTFARVQAGEASVFVWSSLRIFDVSHPLSAEREFEEAVDEYIPAIVLLRFAFGDQCWHNPNPGAGIVIDDPLLKKNYGFIRFPALLESARRHAYRVTLAFIPWNYWRGSATKARMFREYADCFSICVHGCDHTNKEYQSADYEDLLERNFKATERMHRHYERTGVACEPLMVCPQELYSLEAVRAFADSRQFAGLVCTACMPRNLAAPQVCGADLLLPAQDSFFGMPVFKRHYWSDMSVFAMAVFLGKPAILVEHHEFFREGPGGAERFVNELARVRPDIRWASLVETAQRTHQRRRLTGHRHEIQFFTDIFEMGTGGDPVAEFELFRRIPDTTSVRRVMVNGVETDFAHREGRLSFRVAAGLTSTLRVRVEVDPIQPKRSFSRGLKYHAALTLRRGLSEFRDNVVAKNEFALRTAKALARKLRQTGTR